MNLRTCLLTQRANRHFWTTAWAGLIVAAGLLAPALPAWGLTGTVFEGNDGNLLVNDAGNVDWASLGGSPALRIGEDAPSGQTDDSFQAKEDDADPAVTYGSIPKNKSDLRNFYVAHQKVDVGGSERDFLYLAWSRNNVLGTGLIDFEFNQAQGSFPFIHHSPRNRKK